MQKNKTDRAFGIRDKIGYLFGDLGNDFTFILSSSFLLKFYTDVMQVSAAIVGIVMMAARFLDAFTDVTMGRIADRKKPTRNGKFKPWILFMSGPVAVTSFLIYQSALATAPLPVRVAWLAVTYILWGSVFYTSINIPYGSMASAISPHPEDRQSLSTYRTMGSTVAGVIIGVGVPLFAYETATGGGAVMRGDRFTLIAGVFSALAVVSYILCYLLTTERVHSAPVKSERRSFFALFSDALKSRALISIIVASVLMLFSQLTMQQMSNYLFPDYYGVPSAQSASTLAMLGSMTVSAAVAKPLSRRFGKAEVGAVSSLFAAVVSIILYILRPENVWVYVAVSVAMWFGLGIFSMVSWALITDVIDDSEVRHGVREDGSIYALYSFARKLGQAAAAGLSGILLTLIGYEKVGGAALADGVLSGIYTLSTLVPAVGLLLLGAVLWFWYPLHKRRVEENVRVLHERREG